MLSEAMRLLANDPEMLHVAANPPIFTQGGGAICLVAVVAAAVKQGSKVFPQITGDGSGWSSG
jgi:hypothetical protein